MKKIRYGLISNEFGLYTIKKVCDTFGARKNSDILVFLTCVFETLWGNYKDPTRYAGIGAFQVDPGTFLWLKKKIREKYWLQSKIEDELGTNSDWITYDCLRDNFMYGAIFARMRYWVHPDPIPADLKIRDFAEYWKRIYNTFLGGRSSESPEERLANYEKHIDKAVSDAKIYVPKILDNLIILPEIEDFVNRIKSLT